MLDSSLKEKIISEYNSGYQNEKKFFDSKKANFEKEFGLDFLSQDIVGKEVEFMKKLFGKKEDNSLIYVLEKGYTFKDYGSIKGGSSFKFPIWYNKDNQWRGGKSRIYTEAEIITLAPYFKNSLIKILKKGEELSKKENVSSDEYGKLNTLIDEETNNINKVLTKSTYWIKLNNLWIVKYLSILYPNRFCCFYSYDKWVKRIGAFLGLSDRMKDKSDIERNGLISVEMAELSINENNIYSNILSKLLGEYESSINKNNLTDIENSKIPNFNILKEEDIKKYQNIILYGVPGTGKTYFSIYIAVCLAIGKNPNIEDLPDIDDYESILAQYNDFVKNNRITFVTFHQNYSYEDFICGIKPTIVNNNLVFNIEYGIFYRLCKEAQKNEDKNYCLIIDEINRGNISKIFGELITLIETTKRGLEIKLPNVDEPFSVPKNLFIIGTMNSSDKSISLIDVALRRRFNFFEMKINSNLVDDFCKDFYIELNKKIQNNYGDDLLIGHSYFMDLTKEEIYKDDNDYEDKLLEAAKAFINVMNFKIIPLLYEICGDNREEVFELIDKSLKEMKEEGTNKTLKDFININKGTEINDDNFGVGRITLEITK